MAIGPYSTPVAPAKWVDPLDLNMYAKGMAYKQELAEKNLKNLKDQYTSTFNLPAYGVDAEHLAKIEQEFRNKTGSLNLSNLGDMSTISQLRGLINQYTSGATKEGKDLMAITKRGSFYKSELEKKKEAEEKGLPYYSRSLEQLEKYYNNPDFLTEPKNLSLNSGFVGVNLAKARNEALKDVPKEKYLGKDGYYHERYDQGALDEALNSFYTDPRVKKQITYDIEEKWKDKDWETEGVNQINSYKQEAQKLHDEAVKAGRQDIAQDALNDIETYDKMMQDPKGYAEQIKSTVYSQELQDRIDLDKKHSNFDSVDKANEYQMKRLDLANQKAAKLYEMQLKTGIMPQQGESEASYMQRLAEGAQAKDLAIAQAKSDMALERQKQLEEQKQQGRKEMAEIKYKQTISKVPQGKQTAATKTIANLMTESATPEKDEEIIKTMVSQNFDKFIKEFENRTGNKVEDNDDIEGIKMDDDGNIVIEFDVSGGDWFNKDELTLSQSELAEILQDEPAKETPSTEQTTTKFPLPKDKPKTVTQGGYTYTWNEETGQYE